MFEFTQAPAMGLLSRSVAAFARISEIIFVYAEPDSLRFVVANASQTVDASVTFARPAFEGTGSRRTLAIKAKNADSVFTRIDSDHQKRVSLRLSSRDEFLEVRLESEKSRVLRTFKLAAVDADAAQSVGAPVQPPARYYFISSPEHLREILANCMPSADEAELRFDTSGQVGFHSRKLPVGRGHHVNAAADATGHSSLRSSSDSGLLARDISTVVNFGMSRFDQLYVKAPWSAKFRLKELRTMLNYIDPTHQDVAIRAEFGCAGEPLKFAGSWVESGVHYHFQFVTQPVPLRQTTPSREIRINARSMPRPTSRLSSVESTTGGISLAPQMAERERRIQGVLRAESLMSMSAASTESLVAVSDMDTDESSPLEMALTPGTEPAPQGIFESYFS